MNDGLIKRIMVYIDGSETSITAAQYAICLARAFGAQLYALYVVNAEAIKGLINAHIFLKSEETEYLADLEKDAEKYLDLVKKMGREKGLDIKTVKCSGLVNVEIKNYIKEKEIDILLTGEIAKIRSRRDELYDEVERVIRSVSCSVLIVKDEDRVSELFKILI